MKTIHKITLAVIAYLIAGYISVFSIYLISSPGYLAKCPEYAADYKCSGADVIGLAKNLSARPDFWLEVIIWPFTVAFYLTGRD